MAEPNGRVDPQRLWLADVEVLPKEGVSDPEGEAIRGGLLALGHDAVREVRAGRMLRLSLAAASADDARRLVAAMCEQLLANPVIESYRVAVGEGSTLGAGSDGGRS